MKTKSAYQKRFIVFSIFIVVVNYAIPFQTTHANPVFETARNDLRVASLSYPVALSYDSSEMNLSNMSNDLTFALVDREEELTMESWMTEALDQLSDLLVEDAEEKIEMAEWMVNCRKWKSGTDASPCEKQFSYKI